MSAKPSSLAVLKNLTAERQAEIWSRLTEKTETWTNTSYAAVRKWLREDGVETSTTALSDFYSWYPLQQQFRQDEVTTDTLMEQLKQEIPNLTEEQIDDMGQRTFSLLTIRRQDLEGFVTVRAARSKAELEKAKLNLRERAEKRMSEQAGLEREKFQIATCEYFLKWFNEKAARDIASSTASNAEKIAQLRQTYFADVDALQASGKVVLPD